MQWLQHRFRRIEYLIYDGLCCVPKNLLSYNDEKIFMFIRHHMKRLLFFTKKVTLSRLNTNTKDTFQSLKGKLIGMKSKIGFIYWNIFFWRGRHSKSHEVKFVPLKLRKYAFIWWENLKKRQECERSPKISTWKDMKEALNKAFLPKEILIKSMTP